jgi:hypothetical protein
MTKSQKLAKLLMQRDVAKEWVKETADVVKIWEHALAIRKARLKKIKEEIATLKYEMEG